MIKCLRLFSIHEMQEIWEKPDDMQERLTQIQTDSLNRLSFRRINNSFFIVKFMPLGRCCTFFSLYIYFLAAVYAGHCLMYNDMSETAVIALLHIECTILVFQSRTLLHPFPHINLSRVLSLPLCSCVPGLWLICLCPCVIKSGVSLSLPAYLQLQSLYYFRKVVWSLILDYSIPCSTSYAPHVPSSFKCGFPPEMEYGNVF